MEITVPTGALRSATLPVYRNRGPLIDEAPTDPQTAVHLRKGNRTINKSAAATSEARKTAHQARRGRVSSTGRSVKHATYPRGRKLGAYVRQPGNELVDQLAAGIIGGEDGGALTRKGILKERLHHVI